MISYGEIDWAGSVPPPPPALNGGWYTGEEFEKNAPWATVPVIPDTSLMINQTLRLADIPPPPCAFTQYPACNRPGNSYCVNPGVGAYQDEGTMYSVCGGVREKR